MIYAHKVRRERDAVFGAFDCPDAGQSAGRRRESTTPIQALNLFNSRFTIEQADAFAARVKAEAGDDLAKANATCLPARLQSRSQPGGNRRRRTDRERIRTGDAVPGSVQQQRIPVRAVRLSMDFPAEQLSSTGRQLMERRQFLADAATGLGSIALASLLGRDGLLAAQSPVIDPARPNAPRSPHFPPKAKNVVVIFCAGAVSQLETWDYKPELIKRDGQPLAGGPAVTFQGPAGNLARPQYEFRPRGETGKMVSDMIPHLAALTDDIAFIHSLTSKTNTHGPAENFLSTGFVLDGFPSLGSWVNYALGSENQDLPAFVAIPDPRGVPQNGSNNWGPGFLPAAFQATTLSARNPCGTSCRPEFRPRRIGPPARCCRR